MTEKFKLDTMPSKITRRATNIGIARLELGMVEEEKELAFSALASSSRTTHSEVFGSALSLSPSLLL